MARLDKLIQLLHEQHADTLCLSSGQPASLQHNGTLRPLTRDALTDAQIVSLLREIAPADVATRITPGGQLAFAYASPSGAVQADISSAPDGMVVVVRRAGADPGRDDSAAREMIETLFRELSATGASDLHLRAGEPPIFRRDGELLRSDAPPVDGARLEAMLVGLMSPAILAEFRETNDVDWAYEIPDLARFRCNAGRDRHGPFAVVRLIPTRVRTADELGLSRDVQNLCYLTKGLVVVTGPTGSGKTTTLASLIDLMNQTRSDHILTIEDPIEFVHSSRKCIVTQRHVGVHTKSFKGALRAALREDPDVVLVGEMRDRETVSIAIETAESGHLVFGTLHTTTAASTIDRIIDQFPPDRQSHVRVMLAESLRGVIAQVLCRKKGGGRVAAREILLTIPAISNLIREGKTFQIPSIMQTNRKVGMVTLNDSLMELVDNGLVESQEAYMKSAEKSAFLAALKAKRHDTSFLGDVG